MVVGTGAKRDVRCLQDPLGVSFDSLEPNRDAKQLTPNWYGTIPILSLVNEETAANAWRSLICLWRETDKHHAGLNNDVIIMTNFSSHQANANKRRFILLVAAAIVHIEASLLKLWRATARLLLVFCHSCE